MNHHLKKIFFSAIVLFMANPLYAGPGKRTQGNAGGGGNGGSSWNDPGLSCFNGGSGHTGTAEHKIKNTGSNSIRVYRVKINADHDLTLSRVSVNDVCGVGNKKFKITSKSSHSITLKPASGNYITISPSQEIFTGIATYDGFYGNGHELASDYSIDLEFDWRYYEIQGPSSMTSYSYAYFNMGGASTGACSFNWSSRALPNGSWGSIGSGGTKGRTMTTTSFLLKVSHNCPGDNGTRYKTVNLSSNKVAGISDQPNALDFHDMDDSSSSLPVGVVISPNYPNPFNPTTRIEFELFSEQEVDLSVFDLTGRKVETLMSGQLGAGTHSATFNAGDLPNGTYLYILTHETGRVVNRMTLLK